ncbi:MAG: hypothetical protein HDQ87_07485 [Clostridia bacterium]|nr:hypothetical protein [Clostridia bacterium]
MYVRETGQAALPPAASQPTAAAADAAVSMQEALIAAASMADPTAMSLEDYRRQICERISELPVHPSQSMASIAVHIPDAALAAMQQDLDYEAWVLDTLAYDFGRGDVWGPLCGGSYTVHSFGASQEEYRAESWFPGYMNGQGASLYETKSAGAAWQRSRPKRSTAPDRHADLAARLRLERLLQKMALERHQFASELLSSASQRRALIEAQHQAGRSGPLPSAPLPKLHGVPAAYLLALLGGGL